MSPILSRLNTGSATGGFGFGRRRRDDVGFISATGGTITTIVGSDGISYKVHQFLTPGTFTVSQIIGNTTAYIEVIGGGGGGALRNCPFNSGGAGGGAGGLFYGSVSISQNLFPGNEQFDITIGGGGAGAGGGNAIGNPGSPGNPSTIAIPNIGTISTGGGGAGAVPAAVTAGLAGGTVSSNPTYVITLGSTSNPGSPGFGGAGGNSFTGFNTPSYILYPISPSIINRGSGGGGSSSCFNPLGGQGGSGTAGMVRIFYKLSNSL